MTGSTTCYQIRPTTSFRDALKALKERHYRKPRAPAVLLEGILREIAKQLAADPCFYPMEEPPERCEIRPGWEFRKVYITMPGLRQRAAFGRLMYMVDHGEKVVHLVYIYTHAEFETRPPDRDLSDLLDHIWNSAGPPILD